MQVLVRQVSTSVNPVDYKTRDGSLPPKKLPKAREKEDSLLPKGANSFQLGVSQIVEMRTYPLAPVFSMPLKVSYSARCWEETWQALLRSPNHQR